MKKLNIIKDKDYLKIFNENSFKEIEFTSHSYYIFFYSPLKDLLHIRDSLTSHFFLNCDIPSRKRK